MYAIHFKCMIYILNVYTFLALIYDIYLCMYIHIYKYVVNNVEKLLTMCKHLLKNKLYILIFLPKTDVHRPVG